MWGADVPNVMLRSRRHRMRRRAVPPTQDQELIRQPYQGRTVWIDAGEQVKHRVRITYALRQKVPFLLLQPSLCRHGEIPSEDRRAGATAPDQYIAA
jgi:hypothetical protein